MPKKSDHLGAYTAKPRASYVLHPAPRDMVALCRDI